MVLYEIHLLVPYYIDNLLRVLFFVQSDIFSRKFLTYFVFTTLGMDHSYYVGDIVIKGG